MPEPSNNAAEPLMTVADVAEYLKLAEQTIRNKVHRGEIPFVKAGTLLRFRRSQIDEWLAEQTAAAKAESA